MGLLAEIETAATNSSVPIVDLLRRCKVLAARLKHKEFNEWASNELNGYSNPDIIPDYRNLRLPPPIGHFSGPFGSALKNAAIPLSLIPEKIRALVASTKMCQPIAEIEDLAKTDGENLRSPWGGDIIAYMQHHVTIYENMVLMQAHSHISPAMLNGIVDTVRTRVLDYVLAIQAENPNADQAKPADPAPISAPTLHQTFNTTIVGGQANVGGHGDQTISATNNANIGIVQANKIMDEEVNNLLGKLRKASEKLDVAEQEELSSALQKVETQLQKSTPDLSRVKSYLEIAGSIVKLAPVAQQLFEHIAKYFK